MRLNPTRAYYLFASCSAFAIGLHATIYVPYLIELGLTLGEVALVNVVFWGVIVLAEMPTGMLADGKSRSWSLMMGALFCTLGFGGYAFASGFASAALAETFEGIGQAFLSGALSAWITDALIREGRVERLRRVFATEAILNAIGMVVGGVVGALIAYAVGSRVVFLVSSVVYAGAALVAYGAMNGHGEPHRRVTEREAFVASIALLHSSRDLKWIIMAGVLFGSVVVFNHYWSPFFEPLAGHGKLGLSGVWAVMYLALVPTGLLIRRAHIKTAHEGTWVAVAIGLAGLGLLGASFTSGLLVGLSALSVHEVGRGLFRPLSEAFTQHRVESHFRATFGSLQSLIARLGWMLTPLVVWFAIRNEPSTPETIQRVWLAVGLLLVAGAGLLWLARPTSPRP